MNCQQCVMIHIGKICSVDTAIKNVKIIDHTVGLAISWASTFVCCFSLDYIALLTSFSSSSLMIYSCQHFAVVLDCRDEWMVHG